VRLSRQRLLKALGMLAVGMVGIYFLAINIFPIVTNDSLEYLDHSREPGNYGMVFKGYKQIGYPLILLVGRFVAGLGGVEPLLFSALLQRLLLLGALAYVIWLWRWRAIPLVVLVITPSFLVYPNFVLTEGMTVPLSVLLGGLVGHHFRLAESAKPDGPAEDHRIALALAILASAVVFVMISIRFPLAVFGVVPVAILGAAWFRNGRSQKGYVAALLVFVVVSGIFSGLLAIENEREFGVFAPGTNDMPAQYWGAWQIAFALHPENKAEPALAEFFDTGRAHTRIALVQSAYPGYKAQAVAHDADIDEMLELAGLDRNRERLFSFLGALRGGRTDDLKSYMGAAISADARSVDRAIYRSLFAIRRGGEAFAERYNDGQLPQAVITSPVFPKFPSPSLRVMLSFMVPAALVGVSVLSLYKRRVWMGLAYLAPVLALTAAMGWILLDNVRFLIPGSVYVIAGFSALWDAKRVNRPTLRGQVFSSDPTTSDAN
jgi:hypothetical protein